MTSRMFPFFILALVALAPAAVRSQCWDPQDPFWNEWFMAETAAPPGAFPVLFHVPDGSGASFTQARAAGGLTVDATITLHLHDGAGNPIVGLPATDMWLEREDAAGTGNLAVCVDGTIADGPSGLDGVARWQEPLRVGGWSTSRTLVVVCGAPLPSSLGLAIRHNSPDLNGDLVVDLSDVPLFATDFQNGSNAFRSDLHYDGAVNLSDIPRLSGALGKGCP